MPKSLTCHTHMAPPHIWPPFRRVQIPNMSHPHGPMHTHQPPWMHLAPSRHAVDMLDPQQHASMMPRATGPTQTRVWPHHTSGHPSDTPRSPTCPTWPHAHMPTTMDAPRPFSTCCGALRHVPTGTFTKLCGTIYLALKYSRCITFIVFKKNMINPLLPHNAIRTKLEAQDLTGQGRWHGRTQK